MRSFLALVLVASLCATPASAAKGKLVKNGLLSVVEPNRGEPAKAHPFVNVIVLFGHLSDFTPADPQTFKAKAGAADITDRFTPLLDTHGNQIGMRAKLPPERVKLGRRPRNHLRLMVQALRVGKGPRIRDVDRVRFGAVEQPNQPCTAQGDADTTIIVPGVPVAFNGSAATTDPDRDELTFLWQFGDGTSSTEADPEHTYDEQAGDMTATLVVSDGQATCTDSVVLEAEPPLGPGKTRGVLFIESPTALEFGAVASGGSGTKTITLKNMDETDTSEVGIRLATTNGAFTLSERDVTLGPGESHDLTMTFTSSAAGHQHARLSIVTNAMNRHAVSLLTHGYGGAAPDNGPTMAGDTVFYTEVNIGLLGLGTFGVMPDGRRFFADNGVNTCFVPGNGLGTLDFCLTDQDCSANGGTCTKSSTCPTGANVGQPCTVPADCPGSFCPSYTLFDPVDLCSDGQSLFLMSDEGTFTEPDPNAETERAVTVMRMDLDAQGNVTKKDILDRTTTETAHLACDGFPAGQGGQVYIPEFHNVPDQGSCFRSEREALVKIAKSNGQTQVVTGRIDAYEGLGDCDDLDPVDQLEMTRDGSKMFAAFESGGLWQIRPQPIFFSPDIADTFQAHPDASVMYAATTDGGSTGFVNLYRITPEQVEQGPLPYSALVPCASFEVPNNGGRTVVIGFAADRAAIGSQDATALVSFVSSVSGLSDVVSTPLFVKGTVAFSAPANSTQCSPLGLINLEYLELAF
jgi:PKD repeat protein